MCMDEHIETTVEDESESETRASCRIVHCS
jgi:hypothetical protein